MGKQVLVIEIGVRSESRVGTVETDLKDFGAPQRLLTPAVAGT